MGVLSVSEVLLLNKQDKKKWADEIQKDPSNLTLWLTFYQHESWRICQQASDILEQMAKYRGDLLSEHIPLFLEHLKNGKHPAARRNAVRIMQHLEIPETLQGQVFDVGLACVQNPNEDVAIRVFAMTTIGNIAISHPELCNELLIIIEELLPYGTAGFKSRGKKTIQKLRKGLKP